MIMKTFNFFNSVKTYEYFDTTEKVYYLFRGHTDKEILNKWRNFKIERGINKYKRITKYNTTTFKNLFDRNSENNLLWIVFMTLPVLIMIIILGYLNVPVFNNIVNLFEIINVVGMGRGLVGFMVTLPFTYIILTMINTVRTIIDYFNVTRIYIN